MGITYQKKKWVDVIKKGQKGNYYELPEGSVAVELHTRGHDNKRSRGKHCLAQSQSKACTCPHRPRYFIHHDDDVVVGTWDLNPVLETGVFGSPILEMGIIMVSFQICSHPSATKNLA